MNFHISPLSPLRPQRFSTSASASASAGAARPPRRSEQQHLSPEDADDDDGIDQHAPTAGVPGQPTIEVEAAEADGNDSIDDADPATRSSPSSSDDSDSSDSDSADEVTQDSRDVLVQRLNDLAQRLGAANVRSENVEALHAQVDQMERVLVKNSGSSSNSRRGSRSASRHSTTAAWGSRRLSGASQSLQPRPRSMGMPGGGSSGGGGAGGGGSGDALGLMAPLSPSWLMSRFQQRLSIHREVDGRGSEGPARAPGGGSGEDDRTSGSQNKAATPAPPPRLLPPTDPQPSSSDEQQEYGDDSPQMSYEMADRIVEEAEGLCAEMASVIASLQKRREESDHLHAVLIQREIAADKLIHEQASRISELEDTVAEDESELRYLKIQLRGIEAQCAGYIPQGADPELDRSIRSWKKDWSSLRDRWASRRGTSFVSGDESSTFSQSNPTSPSVQ